MECGRAASASNGEHVPIFGGSPFCPNTRLRLGHHLQAALAEASPGRGGFAGEDGDGEDAEAQRGDGAVGGGRQAHERVPEGVDDGHGAAGVPGDDDTEG